MGQIEDTQHEKQNWHWRNTMRPVRFFGLDARVAFILFALMPFWARPTVWFIMIVNVTLFWYLETKGLTFPAAIRAFRAWIFGRKRPAWLSIRHRKMVDYG